MNKGISVHVKNECVCGHMHEVVYHLKDGGVNVSTKWPKLEPANAKEFSAQVFVPERLLELSGGYDKIDFNGLEWKKGSGVVCKNCGQCTVYGLVGEEINKHEQ